MSRQEVKAYGRQEFRSFPLITSEPLPETLHDYIQDNLMGKGGVHMTNTNKHLQCEKTAKTYMFWDNVMLHYKKLAPLYGKTIDFEQYICPHDNWLFNHRDNLKLHNKVIQYETTVATQIERMLNLDNPDWVPPCNREAVAAEVGDYDKNTQKLKKKSRFLKKSQHHEPTKATKDETVELDEGFKKWKEEQEEALNGSHKKNGNLSNEEVGHIKNHWPYDPEDLPPLPRPKPKNVPKYYGWTHSDDADSWFLEAHTPTMYEPYEKFYHNALKQKIIVPKLYSTAVGS